MSRLLYPFILLSITVIFVACNESVSPNSQIKIHNSQLSITAPATIRAGEPASISIAAPGLADGTSVTLTAVGSYGVHIYRATAQNGRAEVILPAADTRRSGQVSLAAAAGPHRSEAALTILSGPATGVIPAWITQRSLPADGRSQTMLVALPQDEWGNPVADGSPVKINSQQPNSTRLASLTTQTGHLLAWGYLRSGTVAGQTRVALSTDMAHSVELSFVEIPGRPERFTLNTDQNNLPADGRRLVRIATSPLRDAYGNVLLDGTSLTFLVRDADGTRRIIPALTINGQAELFLQAPARPGLIVVQAEAAGVLSEPLSLNFTSGPTTEPVTTSAALTADTVELSAGPLTGELGQLVPDGTPVRVELIGPKADHRSLTVETKNGYATASLRRAALATGRYTATIETSAGQGRVSFEVP